MKNFLKISKAVGVLLLVFLVSLSATANLPAAYAATGGIALMSAVYHVSPYFQKGFAFSSVAPIVPDFKPKTLKEQDEMDFDGLEKYITEEKAWEVAKEELKLWNLKQELIKQGTETKEAIETKVAEMIKTIKDEHVQWGLRMKRLSENNRTAFENNQSKLHKWIEENAEQIVKLRAGGSGLIKFEATKAVGPLENASATLPVAAPNLVGVQSAPPMNVPLRGSIVEPLVTRIPTNQAAYAYTEVVPKDGNYAFVAEKGTKPQIDFKIETRWCTPVKVAAYEVLTSEVVKDIPNMKAIATDFLRKKHDLKKENGLLAGDGIAPNPKGAFEYGRAFSAGPLANKVENPNIMDVINACITDIFTTHNFTDEMPYMANIAMMHPADFFVEFVAAKDINGLPLFPTASLFNRVTIGGVTIIPYEHTSLPAGDIFVADLKKYNITDWESYEVTIGWINDQLITNQFTMVGESRFHAFVKKLDEQAFIYDSIATIKAAIAKT